LLEVGSGKIKKVLSVLKGGRVTLPVFKEFMLRVYREKLVGPCRRSQCKWNRTLMIIWQAARSYDEEKQPQNSLKHG
jgi:hypothetical protein